MLVLRGFAFSHLHFGSRTRRATRIARNVPQAPAHTVTGHSRFTQSCSSPPAHLLQLSLQLCTAPTVLSSDMTSEYMWTRSKKPPAGRAGTFECRGQYVSSSMGFVPAYRSRICRGTVCLHSQCDPMCYNLGNMYSRGNASAPSALFF